MSDPITPQPASRSLTPNLNWLKEAEEYRHRCHLTISRLLDDKTKADAQAELYRRALLQIIRCGVEDGEIILEIARKALAE